jgi:hypothetical protein
VSTIKNPKAPVKHQATTPPFDFLYGAFNLNKWTIPYFMVNMTIREAAEYLRLPSELPGSEDIDWKIAELFQRDIDWKRVKLGLVNNYLASKDNPHFFNALTIALLPYDNVHNSRLDDFESFSSWQPPEMTDVYEKFVEVGPIRLGFYDETAEPGTDGFLIGRMQWNPRQVFGVTIDGQHRLAALKLLVEGNAGHIDSTRVPLILLILDKRSGYLNPDNRPIVEMLRALFIDLNKHAEGVSRARQILLDDRDAHAFCVRQLMGAGLAANVSELQESAPRMPLALVDWHSEQAKFDTGPYLTTVLGLDWLVSQVLGKTPRDYTA